MILVDTNVLLDLVTDDPVWASWSIERLEAAALEGPLLINDVVYAELAVRYAQIERLDEFVEAAGLTHTPMPKAALFWPVRPSPPIARPEVHAPACCRISSSERMLPSAVSPF